MPRMLDGFPEVLCLPYIMHERVACGAVVNPDDIQLCNIRTGQKQLREVLRNTAHLRPHPILVSGRRFLRLPPPMEVLDGENACQRIACYGAKGELGTEEAGEGRLWRRSEGYTLSRPVAKGPARAYIAKLAR